MRRLHADLLLLFAAAVWGFAFLFQKAAMEHVGPLLFVTARTVLASCALAPLAVHEMRRGGIGWGKVGAASIPAGLAFFAGAVLQQWGLVTATVTNTGFLTALYVIFTPLLAWALLGRPPTLLVWTAVVLSFAGTWLLGGGSLTAFSIGDGLVALSAVFWALHIVLVGRAAHLARPVAFTMLQFVVVALAGCALTPFLESISIARLQSAWLEIAYVGLLSSALTFTIFSIAMRYTGPAEATIIVSTETLFAALGAWWFLDERLPLVGWIGAGLIMAATLLVQLAPRKAAEPPREATRPAGCSDP